MEDFLNWKLTNRLHDLGYDGKTLMYIDDEEDIINDDSAEFIGAKPAILTSAAFRWFRKNHDLNYWIQNATACWVGYVGNVPTFVPYIEEVKGPNKFNGFDTYEEAEIACLEELIEIVESKQKEDGK